MKNLFAFNQEAGAITEWFLQASDFQLRGDWLNIETEAFHCHIHWSKINTVFLDCLEGKPYSVNFTNNSGHLVFRLPLIKAQGKFTEDTLAAYKQSWQALIEGNNND